MRLKRYFWLALTLGIIGCGGTSSGTRTSTATGTVLDINNQPVRDAIVKSKFGTVRTSTTGAFIMPKQGDGAVEYTAEATRNGVRYRGRTTAFNYKNEKTQSINIIVGQEDELGTVQGQVQDRFGRALQDASVYAYNGAGSSIRTFTDENGNYSFPELVGGANYVVLAGGQGYKSDSATFQLGLGANKNINFVLDEPGNPNLQPPTGVSVTSWVSTSDATRGAENRNADIRIKKLIDPKYQPTELKANGRATNSTLVEVDLLWNEQRFDDLLGYGIYRGAGSNGAVSGLDLLPEPLAAYYVDLSASPRSTYSYAISTLSNLFPDNPDETESSLSDRVVIKTLDKLTIQPPTTKPLTFHWQAGSGATSYVAFVFDEFPSVDTTPIWDNSANRTSATSVVYGGPSLQSGQTYYCLVVGFANNDDSRTISQIISFTP